MERRNLALLCAGVLCFWLFALAVGTAQGAGLRAVSYTHLTLPTNSLV